jgi:hypothetical protein
MRLVILASTIFTLTIGAVISGELRDPDNMTVKRFSASTHSATNSSDECAQNARSGFDRRSCDRACGRPQG